MTAEYSTGAQELRLYIDFKQDESYTPSLISVRVGSNFHDLRVRARALPCIASSIFSQELAKVELDEPSGWVSVPLRDAEDRHDITGNQPFDDMRQASAHVCGAGGGAEQSPVGARHARAPGPRLRPRRVCRMPPVHGSKSLHRTALPMEAQFSTAEAQAGSGLR